MEKSHRKIEKSFDTVMNAIDGVEYRDQPQHPEPEPQQFSDDEDMRLAIEASLKQAARPVPP